MTAILRVKRRYDNEPLNAFVISCKRQKIVENEKTEDASIPLTTFANFAGTVKQHDENVEHLIQTYAKNERRIHLKPHFTDVLNKIRETTKQASAENRYKVVNCFRSLDNSNKESSEETVVTVIDVEDSKSVTKKDSVEKDDDYVYDLYYVETKNDIYLDEDVSVHPFHHLVTYEGNDYPEAEYDSEDSNSESNWRNDYPDSSNSEGSIDEDDIRAAVMNMRIEDGSDSSEEDDFIYAVDENDVDTYGYKYARYKAMIKQELKEDDDDDHLSLGINMSEDSDEECEVHCK
ncbi:putative RNA polymerase II nuclear localization protein SLC7A6OS [Melipona quadrifasciata]|uniref:Putative RNA polymerase II nuclear localization protein SLC7A6OS n=1 Tax=Melipona quadrifasciata TaxID=166423 RepID=A0A0M8ZXL5_9HYME|nr:putative RNA polymerase II nuclear localization protein SLC7A6OS [Melipona quadrifasciata]